MPGTDQQPFTETDIDRYAQLIAGRPDAIVATRHLAAARAVLGGLAQDGRLTRALTGHDAPACDALCRDVESDRDNLRREVEALRKVADVAYRYADQLIGARSPDNGVACKYGIQLREAMNRAAPGVVR